MAAPRGACGRVGATMPAISESTATHMTTLAFLGGMGLPEMLIILVVVLLLFGARKLPELARSMGSSVHEFKKGMNEGRAEAEAEAKAASQQAKKD